MFEDIFSVLGVSVPLVFLPQLVTKYILWCRKVQPKKALLVLGQSCNMALTTREASKNHQINIS